jgi:putative phosphoribosyl transferase
VNDLVCLAIPEPFVAVGQWYQDFQQVSDNEVKNLLAESRHLLRKHLKSPTDA